MDTNPREKPPRKGSTPRLRRQQNQEYSLHRHDYETVLPNAYRDEIILGEDAGYDSTGRSCKVDNDDSTQAGTVSNPMSRLYSYLSGSEEGDIDTDNPASPNQQERRSHDRHLAEDSSSDATFTDDEINGTSTLVLENDRRVAPVLATSPPPAVPPRRSQSGRGQNTSSPSPPMPPAESENEYEPSVLRQTASGNLYIPPEVPKHGNSPLNKNSNVSLGRGITTTSSSITSGHAVLGQNSSLDHHGDSVQSNSDRSRFPYLTATNSTTTVPLPILPVRNNLRPSSAKISSSRYRAYKNMTQKCTWRCTAIIFILLSIALLAALAYFAAINVVCWQPESAKICSFTVEDNVAPAGMDSNGSYALQSSTRSVQQGNNLPPQADPYVETTTFSSEFIPITFLRSKINRDSQEDSEGGAGKNFNASDDAIVADPLLNVSSPLEYDYSHAEQLTSIVSIGLPTEPEENGTSSGSDSDTTSTLLNESKIFIDDVSTVTSAMPSILQKEDENNTLPLTGISLASIPTRDADYNTAPIPVTINTTVPVKTTAFPPPTELTPVEFQLGIHLSREIPPFSFWPTQFYQFQPYFVRFNFSFPKDASVAVYGRKDNLPSHTKFDFMQILSGKKVPTRLKRSSTEEHYSPVKERTSSVFVEYLDPGTWFASVYNDGDQPYLVSFVGTLADDIELTCPEDCFGNGECRLGTCHCYSGYTGEDCATSVCPELCNGNGIYSKGVCVCNEEWKGLDCNIPDDICDIPNCNNHGQCVNGVCICNPGFKGVHCQEVQCINADCSGNGICVNGTCFCAAGWRGNECSLKDISATCRLECSEHGIYHSETNTCFCQPNWTGPDCSKELCLVSCIHGVCENSRCKCEEGWTGNLCDLMNCDPRCTRHGSCNNGSCTCNQGWNGKFCSLEGCPRACSGHGSCRHINDKWQCVCRDDWTGNDCGTATEKNCNDGRDNDRDGLTDCEDSDCCSKPACEDSLMCVSSPDPVEVLLRKAPPSATSTFYDRMKFLIEESSVQSYAHKNVFNESCMWPDQTSQVSVIRGRVVSKNGHGLKGVRVSIVDKSLCGFTLSRDQGWFDIMVNGGGVVTLQFQRSPFKPQEQSIFAPWNRIVTMDSVTMVTKDSELTPLTIMTRQCDLHNYDEIKPELLTPWKTRYQGGCPEGRGVLAESQVLQESLQIPGTGFYLIYHSSKAADYKSTILIQLTSDNIPRNLKFVHLKVSVEGQVFQEVFEARSNLKYTYAWNRQNVYKQRVYGTTVAIVSVGYEYSGCAVIFWDTQSVTLTGYDASISDIGGWNLNIHHNYNFQEGILQKGDGTTIYLKDKPKLIDTIMGDGKQRNLYCKWCKGKAENMQLLSPLALASGPDGTLFVGDYNYIWKISPAREVHSVLELSPPNWPYRCYLTVSPLDGQLYVSDPQRHQIIRIKSLEENIDDTATNYEAIVGNGSRCLPGDETQCGDDGPAIKAKLNFPKGLAIDKDGLMYIADGANIRLVDKNGKIKTIVGSQKHSGDWKPLPCEGTVRGDEVKLLWPKELAINPLDNTLHILDDNMVLKLTADMQIKVIAGRPSHCSAKNTTFANQVSLVSPNSMAFSANGELFIAETDKQTIHQVRQVKSNGEISLFSGTESSCSCENADCACFNAHDHVAMNAQLNQPSAVTLTPDGSLYVADLGNVRIRVIYSTLPKANNHKDYEIYSSETEEVYTFNKFGQHINTRSMITQKNLYVFSYSVNTIYGKLITVTDSSGNKIYVLRDYSNMVNTIENAIGQKSLVKMYPQGFLHEITMDSLKTSFTYHRSTGLLASRTDASGQTYLYDYDEFGRLTRVITPTGKELYIEGTHDNNTLTSVIRKDSRLPITITTRSEEISLFEGSSRSSITIFEDNSFKFLPQDGSVVDFHTSPHVALDERFSVGTLQSINLDGLNNKFEWKYYVKRDPKGKNKIILTGKKAEIGGITVASVEYNQETNIQSVYDKDSKLLLMIAYDNTGKPLSWMPSFNLVPLNFTYDRHGRLNKRQRGAIYEEYSYERYGRLREIRDSSGIVTRFNYGEGSMRATTVTLSGNIVYSLQYDHSGALSQITMPSGTKHHFHVQTLMDYSHVKYRVSNMASSYTWYFNDQEQLMMTLYPSNKHRTFYYYNNLSKLEEIIYDQTIIQFQEFDTNGLPCVVNFKNGKFNHKIRYKYQGLQIIEEQLTFTDSISLLNSKITYGYETVFRINEIKGIIGEHKLLPSSFTYNPENGVVESTERVSFMRKDPNKLTIAVSMTLFYRQFDKMNQDTNLSMAVNGYTVYTCILLYNINNEIIEIKTTMNQVVEVQKFTYDNRGQLIEWDASSHINQKFSYDSNGNLKNCTENGNFLEYMYNDRDQIRSIGVETFIVNIDGFLTKAGSFSFIYNSLGNIIQVYQSEIFNVEYFYDYKQRLIIRQDHLGDLTQYFYTDPFFPYRLTYAYNHTSSDLISYLYDDKGRLLAYQISMVMFYVATDHLGTPLAVYSAGGTILRQIFRNPFGRVIGDSNPDLFLPIGFHGGLWDQTTGLVIFKGRAYNPNIARWMSPDLDSLWHLPENVPKNMNLYIFKYNNPIKKSSNEELFITDIPKWLDMVGFQMENLIPGQSLSGIIKLCEEKVSFGANYKFDIISGLVCVIKGRMDQFSKWDMVPQPQLRIMKLVPTIQRYSTIKSLFGNGVVMSSKHEFLTVHFGDVSQIVKDVVPLVFNNTQILNLRFIVHGRDTFYLVKEDFKLAERDFNLLKKLKSDINITSHSIKPDQTEIHLHNKYCLINIRYGTNLEEERERVLHLAKKRAIEMAWLHEHELLLNGQSGSRAWTDVEKKQIIDNTIVPNYEGGYLRDISRYPWLADDPNNIVFQKTYQSHVR